MIDTGRWIDVDAVAGVDSWVSVHDGSHMQDASMHVCMYVCSLQVWAGALKCRNKVKVGLKATTLALQCRTNEKTDSLEQRG
jgi:hypothetical protein